MKKVIYELGLIVTICIATMSSISGADLSPRSVLSKSSEAKKFVLRLEDIKAEKIRVSILSGTNELLYAAQIKTRKSDGRIFDMSRLPEGTYNVKIEDLQKIQIYDLRITNQDVQIEENPVVFYKPAFRVTGPKMIGFNMLAFDHKVTVEFADENSILYKQDFVGSPSVSKNFDLSQLRNGTYTIRVISAGNVYHHDVRI